MWCGTPTSSGIFTKAVARRWGECQSPTLGLAGHVSPVRPPAVTATGRRSARLEGFSLHADVAVPASGWQLSSAPVVASLCVTLILALLGVLRFGENLRAPRAAGLGLAAIGLVLIAGG
jgi:hypothetical protein